MFLGLSIPDCTFRFSNVCACLSVLSLVYPELPVFLGLSIPDSTFSFLCLTFVCLRPVSCVLVCLRPVSCVPRVASVSWIVHS